MIRSFIKRMSADRGGTKLVRFAIVGTATAAVYLGLLWLGTMWAGLATLLASVVAFLLAVGFNYVLHKSWTFANDEAHLQTGPRYVAMILGGLVINSTILYVGIDLLGLGFWLPQLVSIATMVTYNYVILSQFVFDASDGKVDR